VLCTKTIRFLLHTDRRAQLKFASLAGSTAKQLKIQAISSTEGSVVFYNKGTIYFKSTAALQIFRQLPLPWSLLFIFIAIPPFLRNAVYQWIALNRYKWFGKTNSCELFETKYAGRILE
jgi:predicted DCC family thiol-disulfide oxidoreductase YuxK